MLFLVRESDIIFSYGKIILYFYVSQMPYHPIMMDIIRKLEEKHKDVIFGAIDADYFTGLCRRFEVKSVPTLVILNEGKVIERIIGVPKLSQFADIYSTGVEHGKENQ